LLTNPAQAFGERQLEKLPKGLRREAGELKEVVAELMLENRLLKKGMTGDGGDAG